MFVLVEVVGGWRKTERRDIKKDVVDRNESRGVGYLSESVLV